MNIQIYDLERNKFISSVGYFLLDTNHFSYFDDAYGLNYLSFKIAYLMNKKVY